VSSRGASTERSSSEGGTASTTMPAFWSIFLRNGLAEARINLSFIFLASVGCFRNHRDKPSASLKATAPLAARLA